MIRLAKLIPLIRVLSGRSTSRATLVSRARLASLALAALAILCLTPAAAGAAPGGLDPSFGSGGTAHLPAGTRLLGTAVQSDGKTVAVGESGVGSSTDVMVVRFTSSGALDSSFGSGGIVHGPGVAGSPASVARAVAIQGDGKIVVVGKASDASGTYNHGLLIERFNTNGSLDTGFASGGVADELGGASFGDGYAVRIQPDGKIVATGAADAPGSGGSSYPRVAVVRLNTNGSLDSSFGSGGESVIDLGAFSYALGAALQPDGKIVIVGSQAPDLQVPNALLARLNTNGSLDTSFASGGVYTHQYAIGAANSALNAVTVQGDGKIVAAGAATNGNLAADAVVARFTSSGAPDGSFGAGGVAVAGSATNFALSGGARVPGAYGLAQLPNGDTVAAGDFANGGDHAATLWAFNSSGHPDTAFGFGGQARLGASPGNSSEYSGIAYYPASGGLVAAGDAGTSDGSTTGGIETRTAGFSSAPPPRSAFKLSLRGVSKSYKTSSVARHGLKLTAGCNEACNLHVLLQASAGTARQLHITTRVRQCRRVHGHRRCHTVRAYRALRIAPHAATLRRAGSKTFVLRLSRSLAKAMERRSKVVLTLQLTGSPRGSKHTKTIRKTITFRRR